LLFFLYSNIIYLMGFSVFSTTNNSTFILVSISIVVLVAMVYFALSRQSTFPIRLAALGALAVMFITVIICIIRVFNNAIATAKIQPYPDMPPPPEPPPPNYVGLVSFIVFLLVVFGVVLLLSLREQRRAEAEAAKPKKKFSLGSFRNY